MKLLTILLIALLPVLMISADIDTQIEALKKAPPEKRFEIMNALKREIIKLKSEERIKAIKRLKDITQSPNAKRVLSEIHTRHWGKKHTKTRSSSEKNSSIKTDIHHHSDTIIQQTMDTHQINELESGSISAYEENEYDED